MLYSKLSILLLSLLSFIAVNALLADSPPAYKTTPDGVIIYTDPLVTSTPNAVKLEVITDNIISVTAAHAKEIAPEARPLDFDKGDKEIMYEGKKLTIKM